MAFATKKKLDLPLPQGLYDIDDDQYFSAPGVSNSDLGLFLKSPAHYEFYKLGKIQKAPTKQQEFGTAVHCAILEPWRFETDFMTTPKFDKRTKQGKAQYQSFMDQFGDKTFIDEEQLDAIEKITEKVKNYTDLSSNYVIRDQLLASGVAEVALFGVYPETKQLLRGKVDYMKSDGTLVDIKTTKSAHPRDFATSIAKYGYHRQAAYYLDLATLVTGRPYTRFVFVAIENTAPYEVAVYEASPIMVEQGRRDYQRALEQLDRCLVTKKFPGYQEAPQVIDMPSWFRLDEDLFDFKND